MPKNENVHKLDHKKLNVPLSKKKKNQITNDLRGESNCGRNDKENSVSFTNRELLQIKQGKTPIEKQVRDTAAVLAQCTQCTELEPFHAQGPGFHPQHRKQNKKYKWPTNKPQA